MKEQAKSAARLYCDAQLSAAAADIILADKQTHYLRGVLRLKAGAKILLFNGRDGEWCAEIVELQKKTARLAVLAQTLPPTPASDLWLLMAALKRERLDYLAQKATEMGVGRFVPVLTQRTQNHARGGGNVNRARLQANAIEAAEQCGILNVPEIAAPVRLEQLLADWSQDKARHIIFCDETLSTANAVEQGRKGLAQLAGQKLAVLIGPEGGFTAEERAALHARADCLPIGLGPRILRADTAMVAVLTLVQGALGDWCV